MKYSIAILLFTLFSCQQEAPNYLEVLENRKKNPEKKYFIDAHTNDSVEFEIVPTECIVGSKLLNFNAQTITGETIDKDYLENKMNIINFWFQSCPPCVAEMPGLNIIKSKYDHLDINFISIGNDSKKDIEEFILDNPFDFEHVSNGESLKRDTFQSPWGYPLTIIADKNGIIISSFSGGPTDSTATEMIIDKIEPLIIKEFEL